MPPKEVYKGDIKRIEIENLVLCLFSNSVHCALASLPILFTLYKLRCLSEIILVSFIFELVYVWERENTETWSQLPVSFSTVLLLIQLHWLTNKPQGFAWRCNSTTTVVTGVGHCAWLLCESWESKLSSSSCMHSRPLTHETASPTHCSCTSTYCYKTYCDFGWIECEIVYMGIS